MKKRIAAKAALVSVIVGAVISFGVVGEVSGQGVIRPLLADDLLISTGESSGDRGYVAFDGTRYLVVWTQYDYAVAICGRFVNTLGQLGSDPFVIASSANSQSDPAVAFNGAHYLVVWRRNVYGNPTMGQLVGTDGSLIGFEVNISGSSGNMDSPDVASDGTDFLVIWDDNSASGGIYGQRVSGTDGSLIGVSFLISPASGSQSFPSIGFGGTRYLVVWSNSPEPNTETDMYGALVSTSGSVSGPIAISTAPSNQGTWMAPGVSFDGENYLVVWEDYRDSGPHIYGARVSGGTGVLIDGPPDTGGIAIFPDAGSTTPHGPQVAFDGANWLVAWGGSKIRGTRVSSSGTVVDPDGIDLYVTPINQFQPALASDGTNYLVTWRLEQDPPAPYTSCAKYAQLVGRGPIANPDFYGVDEDGILPISADQGVLDNDVDVEGDLLTAVLINDVGNGTLSLNADGSFEYTPDGDFFGTDTFAYVANDGHSDSAEPTTVTITVRAVNDAPLAADDSYIVDKGGTLTIPAAGLLGNDSDPADGDPLITNLDAGPAHGTLTLNEDGSFTYTPTPGFVGTDTFTYNAEDIPGVWSALGPGGLEARCMAVSPNWAADQTIALVAPHEVGSFFRTTDTGIIWWWTRPQGDFPYDLYFDAIALSPNYKYGGLGETGFDETVFLSQSRFYRSTDSGETWSVNDTVGNSWTIAVSPAFATDGTVFIGGNDDVYKSVDGGVTFFAVSEGLPGGYNIPLTISPNYLADQTIFVATYYGVHKSTNGGAQWSLTSDPFPSGGLCISPDYANDQTIFAGWEEDWPGEFHRSTDGGATWSVVDAGDYTFSGLAISPNYANDRTLFAYGRTVYWKGVVMSEDDGASWSDIGLTGLSDSASNNVQGLVVSPDFSVDRTIFLPTLDDGVWMTTLGDTGLYSEAATVTITVNLVAQNDTYQMNGDTFTVEAPGVLANDSPGVTAVLVEDVSYGTLTLNPDGSFTYEPEAGFYGSDSFTYMATDGDFYSNVTTVYITELPGDPWAWGYNAYGQLGDGTTTDQYTPVQVSGLTEATALAASEYRSLALKYDGTVWAWGRNQYGRLGDGTSINRPTPVQVIDPNDPSGFLADVVDIAAGRDHSLALKSDGTVWAWGNNSNGRLGDNTVLPRSSPVQVIDPNDPSGYLTDVVDIGAGPSNSLAVKSDGTAWAWGLNDYGQLGDGSTIDRRTPVQVSIPGEVTALAAGEYHSLALKSDGTVWAWGRNDRGQLGDGTGISSPTPVQVIDPNDPGEFLTDVKAIAAGYFHSLALNSDGTVWAWGYNGGGQLGDGTQTSGASPVKVNGLTDVRTIQAAGHDHSLALKSDGTVWAWGLNLYGQLGVGTTDTHYIPVQVKGLNHRVRAIAAGWKHSLALVSSTMPNRAPVGVDDGYVALESNTLSVAAPGVLGNDKDHDGDPITAALASDVSHGALALSLDGSFVYTPASGFTGTDSFTYEAYDGELYSGVATVTIMVNVPATPGYPWSWGLNNYGQLGDGTTTNRNTPVQVSGLNTVARLAGGEYHSLALRSDGTVWACGRNDYGQLGDGTTTHRYTPVQVSSLDGIVAIAACQDHSLALRSDGTVWACGRNIFGQLGDGTMVTRHTPVQVSNLTDVVAVAAGAYHSLALMSDGTVWAWGHNYYGQLGDGTAGNHYAPFQVGGLTDVTAIAAGTYHSLALMSDGTVWACGKNDYGQLGDGSNDNSSVPVEVSGLSGVVAVVAGEYHSLALKYDGTVWAWGYNITGQLGDDSTTHRNIPVQVQDPNDPTTYLTCATAVAGGFYHSLAAKTDGTVWAWGFNSSGQLGDGTNTTRYTPVQVSVLTGVTVIAASSYHNLATAEVNEAPVAGDDAYDVDEDDTLTVAAPGVFSNDSDADGDELTAILVSDVSNGTLTLSADGSFTYEPNADFNGTDIFTYKANDGELDSNVASVTITVIPVNDPPTANPDSFTVAEDSGATNLNVLANDTIAPDTGETLTITAAGPGSAGGTITIVGGTSISYEPAADFFGTETFTYTINDGTLGSDDTATVTVTVEPVNDPPVADDQSVTTDEDTPVAVTLTALDVEHNPLTYAIVTPPSHGSLSGTAPDLTYTSNLNYNGPDSFTFKANDGELDSNLATVSITVNAVNDAPVADEQSVSTDEDTPVSVTLTGSDVENDPLTYAIVTAPSHGSLSGTAPDLTYTPNANYNGPDSLTFKANDGTVDSDLATVSITVNAVNDAPVATDQSVTTDEDAAVGITLVASDVDNDPLTYVILEGPTQGALTGAPPDVIYTPNANFHGPDSLTFKANDGTVDSNIATVSVTVNPVNDAPVADDQSVSTNEDTPVAITLTALDVENNPLTYAIVTPPSHGSLGGTPPNVTYTPNPDYNGSDSFTFNANDGELDSNVATVSITVNPVNDAPVAADDAYSVDEDDILSVAVPGVLGNDSDVENDALTAVLVNDVMNGTLSLNADGSFTYMPHPDYYGPESFTYKANDGAADSDVATVTITVNRAEADLSVTKSDDPDPVGLANPLSYVITVTNNGPSDATGVVLTESLDPDISFESATPSQGSFDELDEILTWDVGDLASGASATITIVVVPWAEVTLTNTAEVTANEFDPDETNNSAEESTTVIPATPSHYCEGHLATIVGTDGDDVIVGTAGDDVIVGLGGNDTIDGMGGNDIICGGFGDDVITGGGGDDLLKGGPGNDTIEGNKGNDILKGYKGDDILKGGYGQDILYGRRGNDSLEGGPDNDTLYGGYDDDILKGYKGDDVLRGGYGNDFLEGYGGDDILYGGPDNDELRGGLGNDELYGLKGDDLLKGGPGMDYCDGGDGIDTQIEGCTCETSVNIELPLPDSDGDGVTDEEEDGVDGGDGDGNDDGIPDKQQSNVTSLPNAVDGRYVTLVSPEGTTHGDVSAVDNPSPDDAPQGVEFPVGFFVTVIQGIEPGAATTLTIMLPPGETIDTYYKYGATSGNPADHWYEFLFDGTTGAEILGDMVVLHFVDGQRGDDDLTANGEIVEPGGPGVVPNEAPVAVDDTFGMYEDETLNVSVPGVLGNDSDVNGDLLAAVLVSGPSNGTLTLSPDGSFTYAPNPNFNGSDSFSYKANDAKLDSNEATVTITVNPVKDPPVANYLSANTLEDTAVAITLSATDVDNDPADLSYQVVGGPSHGILSGTAPNLTYAPFANYNGSDEFSYRAYDGTDYSVPATVSIAVTPVNDPPVADDQEVTTDEDTPVAITLTASDVDEDSLTYSVVAVPLHGTLSGTPPDVTYTPEADYYGSDNLTFEVYDDEYTDEGTVSITLNPVNDPPVAQAGPSVTIHWMDQGATVIDGSASDVDGDALMYRWLDVTAGGEDPLMVWTAAGPGGEADLDLAAGQFTNGMYTLRLEASDGQEGGADEMVLTIANSAPTANAGPDVKIHWSEQAATIIHGLAFDADPNTSPTYRWWDVTGTDPVLLQDWTPTGAAGEAYLDLGALAAFPIGDSMLRLEVSDGELTSADDMTLTIENRAPQADAGDGVMITTDEQSATVLHGSATDPDDDVMQYRWLEVISGGDPVLLLDWSPVGSAGEAYLGLSTLPLFDIGEHKLRLEVFDGFEYAHDDIVLTVGNSPPEVTITGAGTYQIGDPIVIGGAISDFDGDFVEWHLTEGEDEYASGGLQTLAGGVAIAIDPVDLVLTIGTHELVLKAFDGLNWGYSDPCVVTVIGDIEPPTLAPVPSVTQLWPPNHQLVPVTIAVNAYDDSGGPVHLDVTVTCDQPVNAPGDGNTDPDWIVDGVEDGPGGMIYLQLRSERAGKGDGRTYTITIVATDTYGNTSSAQVHIIAPHDKGKK